MKFLDYEGLKYLLTFLVSKKAKGTSDWESSSYTPLENEFIIYSDYPTEDGKTAPRIKIGDGKTPVNDLPFTYTEQKHHTLTIGEIVYDGSEDVSVPVYNGKVSD